MGRLEKVANEILQEGNEVTERFRSRNKSSKIQKQVQVQVIATDGMFMFI